MAVSGFRYTPIPEQRGVDDDLRDVNETVEIPKWAGYAVNDFGTKVVAYEDRENWSVILKTFGVAMAMLIIIIAVLLIGLIYLFLRCKGYLNPIRDYAERSNQRCVRCILTLLMLLLLAGILYFVIMAIKNTVSKRHMKEENNSKTGDDFSYSVASKQLDHVFGLNFEEFQMQTRNAANDLILNWTGATDAVSDESKTLCPPAEDITDVNRRVAEVNNEFELLCLGVLEWSDYMHFFYRNMTMFMAQTDDGRKVLKELDFPDFLSKTMQVEKLLDFYRIFSIVDKFFYSFSKLYNTTINWPENLRSRTKNALSPYFLEITKDLGDKGNQFRSLSTTLASRPRGDHSDDDEDYASTDKEEDNDNKSKEPLSIYVLDIICYTLLLLITVVLIIAMLLRCCGKRYRSEARCCNQENGSCLFQFAAFLMFLFLLLVLYPFLWHFVHGAGRYNGVCTRNDTHKQERSLENFEDNCLDQTTFKKILDDHVDRKIKLNFPNKSDTGEVKLSAPELQKYTINFKQSARTSKTLDLRNMCEDIKNRTDPKHLIEVYTKMQKYANGDMLDNQLKTLSQCNLDSFKKRRIDEYEQSVIYISATRLTSYCNRVVEFFTENYAKITGECLSGIESLKDNFSKQSKHELSEIMAGLNQMYAKELDGYVDMAADRVVNKVGLCRKVSARSAEQTTMDCDANTHLQNVSWSALLMLIWLVLPLIPIALYLARLFCMSRDSNCSCGQSGAAGRRNDGWNTNAVMDEMQRHLYKSFCEGSVRSGPSNGQCNCKAGRTAYTQGPNCGKRCRDDGSANFAMLQQANALLLKAKVCSESTESEKSGILKPKRIKESQRPTTSKGMRSVRAKQLANDNKLETPAFKKCVCDKNAAQITNGPSSSMASSRPKKRMRNVCETLEEIVEESTDNGMNGLNINASIHIITFNKKMT